MHQIVAFLWKKILNFLGRRLGVQPFPKLHLYTYGGDIPFLHSSPSTPSANRSCSREITWLRVCMSLLDVLRTMQSHWIFEIFIFSPWKVANRNKKRNKHALNYSNKIYNWQWQHHNLNISNTIKGKSWNQSQRTLQI